MTKMDGDAKRKRPRSHIYGISTFFGGGKIQDLTLWVWGLRADSCTDPQIFVQKSHRRSHSMGMGFAAHVLWLQKLSRLMTPTAARKASLKTRRADRGRTARSQIRPKAQVRIQFQADSFKLLSSRHQHLTKENHLNCTSQSRTQYSAPLINTHADELRTD